MERLATINRTDLARHTRQMVDRARQGDTLIVESYGEEQAVLMDILDYRLIRAVASYQLLPALIVDSNLEPQGLSETDLDSRDIQGSWDQVITAYLNEQISLGRAAKLLNLSRYELDERFRRLDLPRRVGTESIEDARSEVETALES